MAKGFKHGSGGSPMNFKVVAYATEEELKAATPKENTIGVVTNKEITSWIFSATEPTEPTEGMVWINVGRRSTTEFNALKKNAVWVYPLSASQYVNGTLVGVASMSYQGGAWKRWATVLWNASENYENFDVLGVKGFYITANSYSSRAGSISKDSSGLALNSHYDDNTVTASHDEIIDFTNLSTLTVHWTGGNAYNGYQGIGVASTKNCLDLDQAIACIHKTNTAEETVTLDVSNITGQAYIIIRAYNGALIVKNIEYK